MMGNKYENFLESGSGNVIQSFFDNFLQSNADFRSKAGFRMTVIRESIGVCCDWCSDLAGTYDYDNRPSDIYARHKNCNCIVITKTERGTYQDAWSRVEYDTEREARIAREQEILEERRGYYGVPKTWTKTIDNMSDDIILSGTNPGFNKHWTERTTWLDSDYNLNCTNCVPTYEMRCRGYNVTARPLSQNRGLEIDPFLAWENAKPLSTERIDTLLSFVLRQDEGARIQIATEFPGSIWRRQRNHTFIAAKENGKCIFKDPQSGVIIKNIDEYFNGAKEIKYLRIDNLEITDKGVSACEFVKP